MVKKAIFLILSLTLVASFTQPVYSKTCGSTLVINSGVTSIRSQEFHSCSDLTSLTIPDSVTYIGAQAFHSCSKLTSVVIGKGVTFVGNQVFHSCSQLSSVRYYGTVDPIGESAGQIFYGTKVISVDVPVNYKSDKFCGEPVNKVLPEVPSAIFTASRNYFHQKINPIHVWHFLYNALMPE